MKADTVDLAAIFGKQVRYMVPLFQRPYVWTREDQWEPLWQDIRAVAERQLDDVPSNDAIPHFLGAVVLEQALVSSKMIESRSVIDGQQRLTTLQLLLAAARSVAAEHQLDKSRQMFEKLLFNESFLVHEDGDQFKVLPTERDRIAFRESVQGGVAASTGVQRIHAAYRFFRGAIIEWAKEGGDPSALGDRLEALSTALWKRLAIVTIDLDPGDNAQIIFETLNARGTPLLAADLIKNHLFQTATIQGAPIDDLYEKHWKILDGDWWREEVQQGRLKRPRLDIFLNHWLAMRTGSEVVSHQLFPEFKRYVADGKKRAEDVLDDLGRYAVVYESFEKEPAQTALGRFLYRLNVMEVTTAYPALLWLLGPEGISDEAERQRALDAIEGWLVRRLLVRATTKNYNVVFLALLKAIRPAAEDARPTGTDVANHLAGLTGESQFWPTAASVLASLRGLSAYTALPRSRLRMVLEALEAASYTGLTENVILPHDLTIEHVLPQEWAANWPLPEGDDPVLARARRDAAKHTLGNLTLVTGHLNPKMSNAGWIEKREALQNYSVLVISADVRSAETWDESSIAARGDRLAHLALSKWPRPDDVFDLPAAGPSEEPAPSALVQPDVLPVPTANEGGFSSPFAIADRVGVGSQMREIVALAREVGLYPRPDTYSVMVSPPADRRVMLFTVWPQADEDGSFRIWKSPVAFARYVKGITLEAAQEALGSSEAPGVLRATDVDQFLEAVRQLLPAGEMPQASGGTVDPDAPSADPLGPPPNVVRLIEMRASPSSAPNALRFAEEALALDGVQLRVQQSKGDPWYFQVRHRRFSQVVAYVHPRPSELHIQYRLPSTHETYGAGQARDNFYGIVLNVRELADLPVALQLLRDALARPD